MLFGEAIGLLEVLYTLLVKNFSLGGGGKSYFVIVIVLFFTPGALRSG